MEAAIRALNPSASILRSLLHCGDATPVTQLLCLHAFTSARWLGDMRPDGLVVGEAGEAVASVYRNGASVGAGAGGSGRLASPLSSRATGHSKSASCVCLSHDEPLSLPRLRTWLQAVVASNAECIYRIKGVLTIQGEASRCVLHGVHAHVRPSPQRVITSRKVLLRWFHRAAPSNAPCILRWQVHAEFDRPWAKGEVRRSDLVVIGHQLDEDSLRRGFLGVCVADGGCQGTGEHTEGGYAAGRTAEGPAGLRNRNRGSAPVSEH